MRLIRNLSALVLLAAFMTACSTPQKTAYKTLEVVGMSVDKSMKAAAAARDAGKITDADWAKIRILKGDFNAAYNTACDLAGYDFSKFAPEQLLEIQARLFQTIETIMAKEGK